ncbi:MAG: DUF1858 domain-containing protein [Clostridia bacterium]|nr:DUF1858 domain-containing protein [Clostridia bacterium]
MQITKETLIGELLKMSDAVAPILMGIGMHCLGCPSAQSESIEQACMVHGVDVNEVVEKINAVLADK